MTDTPTLPDAPRAPRADKVHWVEPRVRVEVAFTSWTDDRILRHPSFQGLREDLPPPVPTPEVHVSSPDKVLYPDIGLTKRELAEWAARMAPWILAHVGDRPLTLYRCPNGVGGRACFYQKHHENLPDSVLPVDVPGEDEPYVRIRDLDGLVGLVQMNVLEIHPWGARADRPDRPDRLVVDLDPDPSVPFSRVVAAAFEVRDRLVGAGLTSFVRTTGGKGLHVVVPLERRHSWDEVKDYGHRLAEDLVRSDPKAYVAVATKAKRKGRIYVDWLRNAMGATAIGTWSWRARPGAPVAVPLRWEDLDPGTDPSAFTVRTVAPPRSDPWEGFAEVRQRLPRG